MAKNINGGDFLSKSLYNMQPVKFTTDSLSSFLNNFTLSSVDTSNAAGDQIFGMITSDIANINITNIYGELNIGTGNILRIIPTDQQIINDAFTYGVMITTNLYSKQSGLATGYTSLKLDVPYVYNEPDKVLVVANKEAPDNFLEIANSKFRVTGPFTFIKSTKTSFKAPVITLGYYDREESTFEGSNTLAFKSYDKGLIMERVETNDKVLSGIKFSFFGYKQDVNRFVLYSDGQNIGTDTYYYPKMDGSSSDELGVLREYNIGRNPSTIGQNAGNGTLEVDTVYINKIISADNTDTRKLTINSYDDMIISVNRDNGDVDLNKNFDLLLDVAGKIVVNSEGPSGTIQTSTNDYRIQSKTGTFINAYNHDYPLLSSIPVYIGNESTISIDNYVKTTYVSTGVDVRNKDTMVEIGGDFIADDGIGAGSKLLIDGSISGYDNNDIHGIYSKPTIIVQPNNSVNYVSNFTLQPSNLQIESNSDVNTSSTLHVIGATSNATNNYSILSSQGDIKFLGSQSTGSYLKWSDDSLHLFNSRLYINSELADLPVLSFGISGSDTNYYTLKRLGVDGTNELYVDGISSRIALEDNTNYTITGTVMASQGTDKCASYRVEYCLSIRNGIKIQKYFRLNVIVCDIDVNDDDIFDLLIGYSGDPTNFSIGDSVTVTGINTNNSITNWYALLEVTSLIKP